jgi:hypothetical protein
MRSNKKYLLYLLIIIAFLSISLSACYVVPAKEATPGYEWRPVTLRATGAGVPPARAMNPAQARLMARRAAILDAQRNLLEQAYGVTITSNSTVRDFVLQSDTIRSRVEAYIKGARIVDERYLSDGSVEVDMEITLGYDFRRIFR